MPAATAQAKFAAMLAAQSTAQLEATYRQALGRWLAMAADHDDYPALSLVVSRLESVLIERGVDPEAIIDQT